MKGKLFGLGVGPGDPELLTVKALRLIKESDVIAVPGNDIKKSVAYQIVKGVYEELDEKNLFSIAMPTVSTSTLAMICFNFVIVVSLQDATVSFCSCKRIKNVFKSILPKDVSLNLYFSPMTVSINSQTSLLCFINA